MSPWLIKYEIGGEISTRYAREQPVERDHGGLMYHSAETGQRYVLSSSTPYLTKELNELPPDVRERASKGGGKTHTGP